MIRLRHAHMITSVSIPRESGDDPNLLKEARRAPLYSPRERG